MRVSSVPAMDLAVGWEGQKRKETASLQPKLEVSSPRLKQSLHLTFLPEEGTAKGTEAAKIY